MNRPNKFSAIPTEIDGIRFASRAEARRYADLKLLERAGEIRGLELQPRFRCVVDGTLVCTYVADFAYFRGNERVTEDVKSKPTKTPVYRLKMKLMAACFRGVRITEIGC